MISLLALKGCGSAKRPADIDAFDIDRGHRTLAIGPGADNPVANIGL